MGDFAMLKIAGRIQAPLVFAAILLGATQAANATPPRVDQSHPTPVIYPPGAQEAGEQGDVVIKLHISASGKPSQFSVARSSGYDDLDNAALETVLNWHYLPAEESGETVSDWTQVDVVYKLPK
jgi:periplasmic protein TonB